MPLIKSTNTEVKKYLLPFIMLHFEHSMLFTGTDSVPDRYSIIAQVVFFDKNDVFTINCVFMLQF